MNENFLLWLRSTLNDFDGVHIYECSDTCRNDTFESYGIDSIDMIDICSAMEKEFNITIPDSEFVDWETFGDLEDVYLRYDER